MRGGWNESSPGGQRREVLDTRASRPRPMMNNTAPRRYPYDSRDTTARGVYPTVMPEFHAGT
jgi:hypothetical protein